MTKKKPLPAELLAECQAAHALFLAKKNALGLTQRKIAEAAGITPTSVTLYLNGTNALNARFASVLSRLIEEPIEKFSPRLAAEISALAAATDPGNVSHANLPFKAFRQYPVISWVAAGTRRESGNCYADGVAEELVGSTENAGPNGYWLHVKGRSMTCSGYPTFPEGCLILVQPEGFELVSGRFYIAQHRDGEATFKQYVYDAGHEYLVPLNPDFETVRMDEHWEIIGRVVDAKITGL